VPGSPGSGAGNRLENQVLVLETVLKARSWWWKLF